MKNTEIKNWVIEGSYSSGELDRIYLTCDLSEAIRRCKKSTEFLLNKNNSFNGSCYIIDSEINQVVAGFEFDSDIGYQQRKIKKVSKENLVVVNNYYYCC